MLWTSPLCAPESRLSAEELRDRFSGGTETRGCGSRSGLQGAGLRNLGSPFGLDWIPLPVRNYLELSVHWEPVLEIQGLLPRLGPSKNIWSSFQATFRKASGSSLLLPPP